MIKWMRAVPHQLPCKGTLLWSVDTSEAQPITVGQRLLAFPPTRVKSQQVMLQETGSSSGSAALSPGTSVRPFGDGGSRESR